MSNLPISSKYRSTPDRPVDDAERGQLTQRLNDAYTRGELEQADYDQMLDRVYAAATLGELAPVAERLPVAPTHEQPALVRQQGTTGPGELEPAGMDPRAARRTMAAVAGVGVLILLFAVLALVM